MTIESFEAFLTTFGDRIFNITMDNTRTIYIGYKSPNSPKLEDIRTELIGGVEYLVIAHTQDMNQKLTKYEMYYPLETVQQIGVMSEEDADYRVDPIIMK